jgi:gag-polyprotein putative aspartyl protease
MPEHAELSVCSVLLATMNKQSMHLPIQVAGSDRRKVIETEALLDSGAGGTFMNQDFAERNKLELLPIEQPILVKNVDGMPNNKGMISQFARTRLQINGEEFQEEFLITGLGKESIILGLPWLRRTNPDINWEDGTFHFLKDCLQAQVCRILEKTRKNHQLMRMVHLPKATVEEIPDEEAIPEMLPDTEPIGPQDHPKESAQPTSPLPSEEVTPLSTKETTLEEITDDKLLITYIRGEPVIGIFEPAKTPLTKEYKEPLYSYSTKKAMISQLVKSNNSP